MKKSQLISLRLGKEELDHIMGLGEEYGKTTSEKIRTLINRSKPDHGVLHHGEGGERLGFEGTRESVLRTLRDHGEKSEALELFHEWIKEATELYQKTALKKSLKKLDTVKNFEKEVIDELQYMTDKFIRLGMSDRPRVINAEHYLTKLKALMFMSSTVEKYLEHKDLK